MPDKEDVSNEEAEEVEDNQDGDVENSVENDAEVTSEESKDQDSEDQEDGQDDIEEKSQEKTEESEHEENKEDEPLDGSALKVTSSNNSEEKLHVKSAKDKLEKVRENHGLERKHYFAAPAITIVAGLTAFFFLGALNMPLEDAEPKNETPEVNYTDYQEEYVECPVKYLETCTKMSKIPAEYVSFWKIQGGWIYLQMGDGRAIISTMPTNNSTGSFVTYMSAPEVERMRDREGTSLEDESEGNSTETNSSNVTG